MGASNALRVYSTWGATLGDRAVRVLTYMAIVARDNDAEPWFGLGHEALAEMALGIKPDDAGLRAVRRAITELHKAGAITTAKRPSNQGRHVQYRLWLSGPSPDGKRPITPVDNCPAEPVDNHSSPDAQRPITAPVVGRILVSRRTNSDRVVGRSASYPIERRNEEEEERKNSEANLRTARRGRHARDPPQSLPA